jgi:hypothetical protein
MIPHGETLFSAFSHSEIKIFVICNKKLSCEVVQKSGGDFKQRFELLSKVCHTPAVVLFMKPLD